MKLSLKNRIDSPMLASKLNISNEAARQVIKKVKIKLGLDVISIADFLEHTDRDIPDKESWFKEKTKR